MKTILFILSIFVISLFVRAQVPTIEWQKSLGSGAWDQAHSIKQTTDGGYIVAGYKTDNQNGFDYWIVKLSNTGNIEWQKSFGGSGIDNANSIQQTTDGGYIIAGYSNSTDGDITGNIGSTDYWIVKISSTGNIEWQKSLGGSWGDQAYSIQQTSDGGYIIAGYSDSNDGDVTVNNGLSDYWVVKLSNTGIIVWQKSFGGSGNEYCHSIKQTTDGGYIIVGYSNSNDGDVSGNYGDNDFWVVKTNNIGSIEWQKSFGGSGSDEAHSVQQTLDGGFIVAGRTNSNDGDVTVNNGLNDCWVVKLSNTGTIVWQKSFGGSLNDDVRSIEQTTDGGYIIAGYSNSNDGDVTVNIGMTDYWVVKLSNTGNIVWQKSFGGSGSDAAFTIQQTTDGGYIVAGFSGSTDGDVTGNNGGMDYWVVKLSSSVGVDELFSSDKVSFFPNPTSNHIKLKVNNQLIGSTYSIYNNLGILISTGQIKEENIIIKLDGLSSGFYLISIGDNNKQTFKVIKN